MKKSIIAAGAASIALAALPMAGVFAAQEQIVDNLSVTLNSTCTMTRTGASSTTAADGVNKGAWTAGNPEATSAGTYAVTMDAGALAELGTSTFTITCNDAENGHSLAVTATGLTSKTTGATTTPIKYSATTATAGTSSWNIVISDQNNMPEFDTGALTSNIVNIAYGENETSGTKTLYGASTKITAILNGASFKATYNVGTAATQPSGVYTGSATYTLTHGA